MTAKLVTVKFLVFIFISVVLFFDGTTGVALVQENRVGTASGIIKPDQDIGEGLKVFMDPYYLFRAGVHHEKNSKGVVVKERNIGVKNLFGIKDTSEQVVVKANYTHVIYLDKYRAPSLISMGWPMGVIHSGGRGWDGIKLYRLDYAFGLFSTKQRKMVLPTIYNKIYLVKGFKNVLAVENQPNEVDIEENSILATKIDVLGKKLGVGLLALYLVNPDGSLTQISDHKHFDVYRNHENKLAYSEIDPATGDYVEKTYDISGVETYDGECARFFY